MDCGGQHIHRRSDPRHDWIWHRSCRIAGLSVLAFANTDGGSMNRLSKHSAYMEWAKLCSIAPFNLATSGLTNTPTAEFPLPRADMEITGPGGYGFAPLQERLARHTGAPAESVVAATGTSMANFLAMSVALDPGDEVLIESPGYGLFADIANYLGTRIGEVHRPFQSDFMVDPDRLADAITPRTRLIVLSNLHNPS